MSGYELISADSHVLEPGDLFEQRLPASFRDRAPRLVDHDGGSAWVVGDLDPVPLPASVETGSGYRAPDSEKPVKFSDSAPRALRPAASRRAGRRQRRRRGALPVAGPVGRHHPLRRPRAAPGVRQGLQRLDHRVLRGHPNRLIGIAKLPISTQEDAKAEAERAVKELGLKGVMVDDWPGRRGVAGADGRERVLGTINELRVPVTLHYAVGATQPSRPAPASRPGSGRRPPRRRSRSWSPASSTASPNVRFVIAHGDAGWAMHWLEFLDINYVRMRHLEQFALEDPDKLPERVRARRVLVHVQPRPLGGEEPLEDRRQPPHVGEPLPARHHRLARQPPGRDAHHRGDPGRRAVPRCSRGTPRSSTVCPVREGGFAENEVQSYDRLVYF